MNPRQQRFAELYAQGSSATDAYVEAGYENEYPGQAGARLAKNDEVVKVVERLRRDSEGDAVMSIVAKRHLLAEMAHDRELKAGERIAAMKLDSALAGHYPKQGTGGGGVPNTPYIPGNHFTVRTIAPNDGRKVERLEEA